jgi:hypothetical protein
VGPDGERGEKQKNEDGAGAVLKSARTTRGAGPGFHYFHHSIYDAIFHDRGTVSALTPLIGTFRGFSSCTGDGHHEASVGSIRVSVQ